MLREIEGARSQVEVQLALLMANPNRAEIAEEIGALQAQLSQLDGLRGQALSGNVAQLATLQTNLSQSVGTIQTTAMQLTTGAGAAAHQSVMLMSQDQLAELAQDHAAQSARYQSFETDMFTRIDALSAVNGRDMSGFQAVRSQLLAEFDAAKDAGDTVGMAQADALRATNLRRALEDVGASDAEIRRAIVEEAAREQAYLEQVAMRARASGEDRNLTGQALSNYVAMQVSEAEVNLQERKEAIAEEVRPTQDAERVNALMTALSNVRADHAAEQIMTADADSLTRDRDTNADLDIALDNANLSAVLFQEPITLATAEAPLPSGVESDVEPGISL